MFVQLLYFFSAFASHYTLASEVPPSVIIKNGVNPSFNSSLGNGTFTGDVWLGTAYTDDNATIAHVFFTPSARTFWHRHEKGQLLNIVAGTGRLGDKGSEPRAISAGDIVWCPPGVIHWHGANPGSHMIHLASGYGATEWFEEVTDQEYTSGAFADAFPGLDKLPRQAVRLGFHDAGAWVRTSRTGSIRCVGLEILDRYQGFGITAGDLVQFMHNVAGVFCPLGPRILTVVGRTDNSESPAGLLPTDDLSAGRMIVVFANKTFGIRYLVPLIGLYTTAEQFFVNTNQAGALLTTPPWVWDINYY